MGSTAIYGTLAPHTLAFYQRTITQLQAAGVPFLVAGAYAFAHYTGIERHTKDFDVFVRQADAERALAALAHAGCRTELTYPHWLGKAFCGDDFVDVIFSAGNGVALVDDDWFVHAVDGEILGASVKVCPVEEMLWSKAFIMERERYDGADVAHLLHAQAAMLDWQRLLDRFNGHWHVLLSHLVLFCFIYPDSVAQLPAWVMRELLGRLEYTLERPGEAPVCQGTLLSRAQYLVDIERRGYRDARLAPEVAMTPADIALWTDAIEQATGKP